MEATIVDLRCRMKEVLKALDRNEAVQVLYHGKLKGVISPAGNPSAMEIREHPFFNMSRDGEPVQKEMERIRGGRYGAL